MQFPFSFWGGYTFINSQAKTYWDALTTANGGVEVSGSVYGVTTNALKKEIDSFFITGDTDGWLAEMIGMYLLIGATSATHAINACNPGTYNITWVNSPSHSSSGVSLNGSSQYGTTAINNAVLTQNAVHLSVKTSGVTTTGVDTYIGASNGTTQRTQLVHQTSGTLQGQIHNNTDGAGMIQNTATRNNYLLVSRRSSTDIELYEDGVSIDTGTSSGGSEPTYPLWIGALNNLGAAANYMDGTLESVTVGAGLSTAQASSFYTALSTLNTILGR